LEALSIPGPSFVPWAVYGDIKNYFIFLLANLLAFYLTYLLAFYLAYLLA
jgi:hypothetical protein